MKSSTPFKINLIASFIFSATAMAAQADSLVLSDFFHDWKLNAQSSDSQCPTELRGLPGYDVPGVMGQPGRGFDASTSVRFEGKDRTFETISLEPAGSSSAEGKVSVTLNGNQLKVVDRVRHLVVAKSERFETYTLADNKDLVYSSRGHRASMNCVYTNAHPELVGKKEVGASLWVDGQKIDQCQFVSTTMKPFERDFMFYNEKCSFGRYAKKTIIDRVTRVLSVNLVKNQAATRDFEILRSSKNLNAGSENYFTLDNEIAVDDSLIDDIFPNQSHYFISPYKSPVHPIDGVNAAIHIEYAPATR